MASFSLRATNWLCVALLFTTVAVVFGDVVVPGLYSGVTNRDDDWVWNAAFVSALSVSAVAVGLAGAGAYDIGIGVFGDEPVAFVVDNQQMARCGFSAHSVTMPVN